MTKEKIKQMAKRLYFYDYSGRYCKKCGFDSFKNPWIMDYHHREPEHKSFDIGKKISRYSFDTLKDEVDKCDLLCGDCHRTTHYENEIIDYTNNLSVVIDRLESLKTSGGKIDQMRTAEKNEIDKKQLEELIDQEIPIKKICEILGRSYESVKWSLRKHKIKTLKWKRNPVSQKDSMIRDYISYGYSILSLVEKYSMSEEEITHFLKSNNLKIREYKKPFTENDIEEIKKLLSNKVKIREIAAITGRHNGSIYKIIKKQGLKLPKN
jgi:hypothetical protein